MAWRLELMNLAWELDGEAMRLPSFVWRTYRQPSANWDHDHCVGCTVTFSEKDVPGALKAGWATGGEGPMPGSFPQSDPIRMADGSVLLPSPVGAPEWLCPDCHALLMAVQSGKILLQWTTA